jgi:drug/metabolite transporter (DMT)-like permease
MTLAGWSSVPLFITHLAEFIDVWTSNGWRYAFSALLWAPVLIYGYAKRSLPAGLWRAAIVPSLFNAIGQAAFAWSFYNIDPATATFGLRLQIVFVAVGAYLMFPSERAVLRTTVSWLGIVLVLGGIAGTLFLADRSNPPKVVGTPADHGFGVALAIFAGLLFAAYGLSVRKCMHAFHPVTAFAAISQYTSLILVLAMFAFARDPATKLPDFGLSAFSLTAGQFGMLLLSAVIGIALGHVFYYISIARLGVAVSSGVIQLQPFCVAIGQLALFNKPMTSGQWGSGTLAVLGAVLLLGVQWRISRQTASARAAAQPPPTDQPE